ncbi:hypothetical protein [Arcanobacterium canis]
MNAADFMGADIFPMPHLLTYTRLRPKRTPDPYNPDATVETGETDDGQILGYMQSNISEETLAQPRTQTISTANLVIPHPNADIQAGDYIQRGPRRWRVIGFTASDVNPFTGWQPTLNAHLEEVLG